MKRDYPHNVGARNPRAVLTAEQVRAIRAALRGKRALQKCIAADFGIAACTVSAIKTRRIWAHVKRESEVRR